MTCGIYCYIDIKNNNIVYIGQSVNIERRHNEHLLLARYHDQPFNAILQNNKNRYNKYYWKILYEKNACVFAVRCTPFA